jgi:asparagine synthase (glutamine-hydrolysing)
LHGGERLTLGETSSRLDALWSPRDAALSGEDGAADQLAERIRHAVTLCARARASAFDRVLLLLSGGLDSSIVASSLATAGTPFSVATMTTLDALGDERDYAGIMAEAVKLPLYEALRDVARIDPERSTAARLPRPAGRLFDQETLRIAGELASRTGASAIVTGGGGDNVFCSLQSAAPVADRLLTQGPGRGVLDTACDIARVAQVGVSAVLWSALSYLPKSGRRSPVAPDLTLLADGVRAAARGLPHAWLGAPSNALPGTAAHIKLLAAAESFMQGFDPEADVPLLTPLLGQPLVEACLAIPSWRWFAKGLNRAVARRAFAGALPDCIANRRSKGTPDSFVAEIYERYHPVLRERLLGGLLASEGIIDAAAVDRAFARTGAFAPPEYRRLLRLSEVETWARTWAGRPAPER